MSTRIEQLPQPEIQTEHELPVAPAKVSPLHVSGVTLRSVILGLLVIITITTISPYAQFVMKSTVLTADHFSLSTVILFSTILMIFNVFLSRFRASFALTPQELIVIFLMGMVAAGLTTNGFVAPFVAVVTAPYLHATPENRWAEYFLPYLPDWAAVHNQDNALLWYRDGLPEGESIPWGAWVVPLFWWLSLSGVVIFMALCITVILRKQWVEHERLVFPLMQVPLALIRGTAEPPYYPAFLRSKGFWIGFGIPFVVIVWNIIGYFTTVIPPFPYFGRGVAIVFAPGFPALESNFYPPILGIAYFVNLDVLAGIWFFYFLGTIEIGVFNRLGFTSPGYDNYGSEHPAVDWQNMGAFYLLVLWGLWRARHHIRDVVAKAFGRRHDLDDSAEFLSYRTAVFGILLGGIYCLFWLHELGISVPIACLLLITVFVIYIGTSRIICESGVPFIRGPIIAQVFTHYSVGTINMSNETITGISMTYGPLGEIKSNFTPPLIQGGKLSEQGKGWGRSLGWVIGLAAVSGLGISLFWTIHLAYTYGATQLGGWWFLSPGPQIPFDQTITKIQNHFGPDLFRISFFGIGAGMMFLVMVLRAKFAWWPIHPLGMAMTNAWPNRALMLTFLLSWLIKRILLWVGGLDLYRKGQPFFLGLIFGFSAGVALSLGVDFIWFRQAGHWLYGLD
jgi:hypothetical protein